MGKVLDRSLKKRKEKYWIAYIRQRIQKNKNFLGFISGPTGSGKSYSTLRICEEIDPEFNIDKCVFGGLELMNLINSGTLRSGSAVAFEEVGVELSNKNWASITNKMLNYLLQTFRHRNFILIMNSPYMDFVDASTRKLFHAEMQTVSIDFKKQEVLLKPQLIQYNSRLQKFYFKRLKVIRPEGKVPVDVWRVAKPSEHLRLSYEQKKTDYTNRLNKKIVYELETIENKGKKKKQLTLIQEETLNMLREGFVVEQIAKQRSRAPQVIRETITGLKNKGYKLKPVYDGNRVIRYEVQDPSQNM